MIKVICRLAAVGGVLMLGACLSLGNIDRRAGTFNTQVADMSNQAVLFNLARASQEEPIYFLALNQISGTATTDFHASAPSFMLGPNLPAIDKFATFNGSGNSTFLDNTTNSNFQLSVLGSQDFYNGLLGPLGLRDVDLLLHQGYSRELIFYLVIEKAKITVIPPKGAPDSHIPPQVVYNDPRNSQNFALFQYYIKEAMEHGLTTETFEAPAPVAPVDATATNKPPAVLVEAELCYDKALATPADVADIPKGSFCGDKPSLRTTPTASGGAPLYVTLHDPQFPLHDQQLQIDVSTRSIYEIFYYLGHIIGSGKEVDLQGFNLPAEQIPAEPLIDVQVGNNLAKSEIGGVCFSAVSYEGKSYCVPHQGATNTKRIFGILNALLALKQSVADLPTTQTVRVEQ
jgi:hypothetical protein